MDPRPVFKSPEISTERAFVKAKVLPAIEAYFAELKARYSGQADIMKDISIDDLDDKDFFIWYRASKGLVTSDDLESYGDYAKKYPNDSREEVKIYIRNKISGPLLKKEIEAKERKANKKDAKK